MTRITPVYGLAVAGAGLLLSLVSSDASAAGCRPVYVDNLPAIPSQHVSHHTVGGPVLADDFIPTESGRVECADWIGSRAASDQWEITLHLNVDNNPAAPDAVPALTGGYKLFVQSAGMAIPGTNLFYYWAEFKSPLWYVEEGKSYWFSTANLLNGWTWATTDGIPEVGGQLHGGVSSVGSTPCPDGGPHCGAWTPFSPVENFAFSIYVPEPGTLALLGLGLAGFGVARRRRN